MKSIQKTRDEMLQKIKDFCLMDDTFMSRVFDENIECTELPHTPFDRHVERVV